MWSQSVKEEALVACGRRCCICHCFCGVKIELHHIVEEAVGGPSTIQNCIPLCFNCHADVGHYNPRHPKGNKYSPGELRRHRDTWFSTMAELGLESEQQRETITATEFYEGQTVQLTGFVWREAFPGPPNYESLKTDQKEVCWMLVLRKPVTLIAVSPEDDSSYKVENITRVQMNLSKEQYAVNREVVMRDALVIGQMWASITGHHHGDALIKVSEIQHSSLDPIVGG